MLENAQIAIKQFFMGLAFLWFVATSGCDYKDFTPAEAQDYFNRNEPTFVEMVRLISQCEGRGHLSIYPDGRVAKQNDKTEVRCPSVERIIGGLKATDVKWVIVGGQKPFGQIGPFGAMFVLSSRGIVGSGSGNAIYYMPELDVNPFGDSTPLRGSPGHWFFRKL